MASGKPEAFECRRPASAENTTFQNMKEHFEDFKNASMEEHKKCLMNTFNKVSSRGSRMAQIRMHQLLVGLCSGDCNDFVWWVLLYPT